MPNPNNPQDYDRYSYVRNNPVRYHDPSGHDAWDVIGQFSEGMVKEFASKNTWVAPQAQEILNVNVTETDAMIAGRIAGDILTVWVGVIEVNGGIGIAGSGVAACGTGVLCLAGASAISGGAVVAGYGATTALAGAGGKGENAGILYSRRTEHGELRASQGRPTGPAWTDAQKAGNNGVLFDTETGNYVVRGEKGRIHIFKLEDDVFKLDTSFRNPISNTQQRILSGKWEYLTEDQYQWWKNTLDATLSGE